MMKVEEHQKVAAGGPAAVQTCPAKAVLTISVRTAFFNPGEGECYFHGEEILGATFKIDGAVATGPVPASQRPKKGTPAVALMVPVSSSLASSIGAANRKRLTRERNVGVAELSIAGVLDGPHVLEIVPPPGQDASGPADAAMTDPGANKQRFRPVHVLFVLVGCKITGTPVVFDPARPGAVVSHAYLGAHLESAIAIDWKPDWAWSVFQRRARSKTLDLIVVHHTSGEIISGAYNMRTNTGQPFGAHYEIDIDGHVVKYGVDSQHVNHAAPARWGGVDNVNTYSIGIEVVHRSGPFREAQYMTLLRLLRDLVDTNGIPPHRIIGHSDCDVHQDDTWLMGDTRVDDPSPSFEWTRVEAIGLGMIPQPGLPRNQGWAAYFATYTDALRTGDNDGGRKWGRAVRALTAPALPVAPPAASPPPPGPAAPGAPAPAAPPAPLVHVIKGLQKDLIKMGYSIPRATGTFDAYTMEAVKGFKRHFYTGTRARLFPGQRGTNLGHVDADTAWYIQAVAAGIP